MDRRRHITTEVTTDSLEDVFDLQPGTTTKEVMVVEPTQIVSHEAYDEKDAELDEQFQEIYDKALGAFEFQMERADSTDIEPKYVARMHEVANQYLNTALAAAREKAGMKANKDKVSAKVKVGNNVTNNNTVVMTHSELLKLVRGGSPTGQVIDGEFGDV